MYVSYLLRTLAFCSFGKAPTELTHESDSHHKGRTLLQLKKRCAATSSELLHNGNIGSLISTCLPLRFIFVGKRSLISRHVNTAALGGILSFHKSTKIPSSVSPLISSASIIIHACPCPCVGSFNIGFALSNQK